MTGQHNAIAAAGLKLLREFGGKVVNDRFFDGAARSDRSAVDPAMARIQDDRDGSRGRRRRIRRCWRVLGRGHSLFAFHRRLLECGGFAARQVDLQPRRFSAVDDGLSRDAGDPRRCCKVYHYARFARAKKAEAE